MSNIDDKEPSNGHLCPECGGAIRLYWATVYIMGGLPVDEDGFDLMGGKSCDTTDEEVRCVECEWEGVLSWNDDHYGEEVQDE